MEIYELIRVASGSTCVARLSTRFGGELMFMLPEQMDGILCFVGYEGRRSRRHLEQRQAVFRNHHNFWEVGDHEWETNEAEMRKSYDAEWVEPQ